jgi:hypothetical protein
MFSAASTSIFPTNVLLCHSAILYFPCFVTLNFFLMVCHPHWVVVLLPMRMQCPYASSELPAATPYSSYYNAADVYHSVFESCAGACNVVFVALG